MSSAKILVCFVAMALLQASCQPQKLPLYVGRGYDLLTGNPLSNQVDPGFEHSIFEFTYNNQETTEDGRYLIPDGVSHRKVSSCTFSTDVRTYRGTQSYSEELKTKATISAGYKGLIVNAAFSASTTYDHVEKSTLESNMSITHATASCEAYELSIDIFTVNNILPNFVTGAIESYQSKNWGNFITQFGTHFVFDATMGGRATQEITYDFQTVSKLNSLDIDISVAAKASFAKFFMDASFDWSKHTEEIAYAEKMSKTMNELYIGGEPPKDGNIHSWVDHVIENPMPIKYKVIELSQLFSKIKSPDFDVDQAKVQFHQALDDYCESTGCKKPTPDRVKPGAASVATYRSQAFGGNGGEHFEFWEPSTTFDAVKFIIRHGSIIYNIQILLGDGVKKMYTPAQGGLSGVLAEWAVPEGQYVTQIQYRSGYCLDSITFVTNTGLKSPYFGGGGGNYHLETFVPGHRIIGFHGRSNTNIDQFGFILGRTVYPPAGEPYVQTTRKQLKIE